jgi:hypothetical protein
MNPLELESVPALFSVPVGAALLASAAGLAWLAAARKPLPPPPTPASERADPLAETQTRPRGAWTTPLVTAADLRGPVRVAQLWIHPIKVRCLPVWARARRG